MSEADGEMAHHHVIRDSNYFLNREGVHYRGQVAGTRATGDTGPDMSDTFCFINIATDRSDTPLITALPLLHTCTCPSMFDQIFIFCQFEMKHF